MKQLSRGKALLIFWGFDIILILILLISFLPMMHSRRNSIQSAVLNSKYADSVSDITIEIPKMGVVQKVHLVKENDIWFGSYEKTGVSAGEEIKFKGSDVQFDFDEDLYWPCDIQTVTNLISTASRTVNMYKKSDRKDSWENLNVDDANGRCITFADSEGNVFSKLYYGVEDPITQRIVVRSTASDRVLETESKIKVFLTSDISFWADPFVFPQCITSYDRNTSENLLRRGKLSYVDNTEQLQLIDTIEKSFENEAKVILNIYKNNDSDTLVVKPNFVSSPLANEEKHNTISRLHYCYNISAWTYENLKTK